MLVVQQVNKDYSGPRGSKVLALRDIDLTVDQGEWVMITGPSGSGKSTLLFTIGAMLEPTTGNVRLEGTSIYDLSAGKRAALRRTQLGFMFQTFNLVPYLSCIENVILPAAMDGVGVRTCEPRARELLERLGLGHRLHHQPSELSVGERQRVALARAMMNRPRILLADEPTGNLDPHMTGEVVELLAELHREGQTIVMATHAMELTLRASRVLGLREGVLVEDRKQVQLKEAS